MRAGEVPACMLHAACCALRASGCCCELRAGWPDACLRAARCVLRASGREPAAYLHEQASHCVWDSTQPYLLEKNTTSVADITPEIVPLTMAEYHDAASAAQ